MGVVSPVSINISVLFVLPGELLKSVGLARATANTSSSSVWESSLLSLGNSSLSMGSNQVGRSGTSSSPSVNMHKWEGEFHRRSMFIC